MYGPGVMTKSVERVTEETAEVYAGEAGCIYFIDLEFTLHRERALEICRRLAGFDPPPIWCCQTRADTVDPEILACMKEAGCRLIHFGVETGSPRLWNRPAKA